jgi:uncharacterized membrane protein YeaQ/YmgE (transglycosylase-associated protein family)
VFFILALVVIPLAAGFVANLVVGKNQHFQNWELFVAGIIGSFVGGAIGNLIAGEGIFGGDGFAIHPSGLIGSTIGAIIVLAIWGFLRTRMAKNKLPG